ncbi:DUF2947 domain-containing protein [Vibrio cholerae]|uniref:DUF2947 domain-containing protein n=1 Tax=Vibrio cholerae TaxID=666 RepID=UPI0001BAE0C4|nr:DUF2947 domain-containing protein [Vibrio cholerae]EEY51703.1 hypothetical protein VIH_001310 [Vibrio cholerae CT 5369-93]AKB05830.1 hypothetical protein VAB027_1986 [Vibrio cholerae]EGQ7878555.1 DUF2947 domain-containing protein [Vibrio cholerae]EGQ9433968.1 DUF2947 family protein [Vibrio cholerae]EGQ9632591.1 DUF2947 family protein [Vibrio cholerae]
MSYLPLDQYQRKWIFTHASMPVPEADLAQIKPMEPLRAAQFWKENISDMSPDAERLSSHDWPRKANSWSGETGWMAEWESDEPELPEALAAHLPWQDDVTVYFCYEKYNVLETKWSVFKRHWKNFLFYDDGPFLLGRRRKEALWFSSEGKVKFGLRP